MHKIFLNDDVTKEIIAVSKRGSLAALARTCKVLSEPAQDRIWHTLLTPLPLFKCFPSDVWVESPDGVIVRRIISSRHQIRVILTLR